MDDRLHQADGGMPPEQGEAGTDNRVAGKHQVLLRPVATGAHPAPACDHHRGNNACHIHARPKMKLGHGFSAFCPVGKPDLMGPCPAGGKNHKYCTATLAWQPEMTKL